jgi:predicted transcriptional regulator
VAVPTSDTELGRHVSDIVSAYVANHRLGSLEITALIQSVYRTLAKLAAGTSEPEVVPYEPAVPIKKSVFLDYIICLEDGKKLKMMKRYLRTAYNMTPQEYRQKWGLPADYPMTAPGYTARRSTLAKANGLGQKKGPTIESTSEPVIQKIPERRRGRPRLQSIGET